MTTQRLSLVCAAMVAASVLGTGADAQQRPQPRPQSHPMSINEWLQAERNNANMQRAREEYERARYGTATPQRQPVQPQYQQPQYRPPQPTYQQPYYPEQAQTSPQAAPQTPVQPQPLSPDQPPQYQQPQQWQQPNQPQTYPAQPGGQIPQQPNRQNTYQAPPNALEKIDKEYKNSSPGFGGGTGYYVSVNLGWPFVGSSTYDFGSAEVDAEASMLSFNVSSALGYKLGNGLSLELAGAYHLATYDEITATAAGTGFSISNDSVDGTSAVAALLANAKFEMPLSNNVAPYVIGGIGPAIHFINSVKGSGGTASIDDSALTMAYQFGTGVMIPISNRTSLDVGYRYFGTMDTEMEFSGLEFDADFSSHSLMIGFTQQL